MSPEEVVDAQLVAYNARDIGAFAATYADDVCVYDMSQAKLIFRGRPQIIEHYGNKTFKNEGLRAEILSRMVIGNKIIDHEKTWGLKPEPAEFIVVYEVQEERIQAVWFFKPNEIAAAPTGSLTIG